MALKIINSSGELKVTGGSGGGGPETDPIFSASAAAGILSGDITNWNDAFSWGDHSLAGYLTSSLAATTYVPLTRNITINGTTFDMSADRTWSVGDVLTSGSYSNPAWITGLAWSKITGTPTTLSGYGITDGQPLDATLTALSGLATGSNKIPYSTGTDTFSQLDLDIDGALAANSDARVASQKATKTYADTKVPKSAPAYTFRANNTNAVADVTDLVFKEIAEQTLSSVGITWVGTLAPSSTETHRYRWMQIGKKVEITGTLKYASPGTSLTAVFFPLPSDLPTPFIPTGFSGTSDNLYTGSGRLIVQTNTSVAGTNIGSSLIRENSTGGYEIWIGGSSGSHRIAMFQITYWTT